MTSPESNTGDCGIAGEAPDGQDKSVPTGLPDGTSAVAQPHPEGDIADISRNADLSREIIRICNLARCPLKKGDVAKIRSSISGSKSAKRVIEAAKVLQFEHQKREETKSLLLATITNFGISQTIGERMVDDLMKRSDFSLTDTARAFAYIEHQGLAFREEFEIQQKLEAVTALAQSQKIPFFQIHLSNIEFLRCLKTDDVTSALSELTKLRDIRVRKMLGLQAEVEQTFQAISERIITQANRQMLESGGSSVPVLIKIQGLMPCMGSQIDHTLNNVAKIIGATDKEAKVFTEAMMAIKREAKKLAVVAAAKAHEDVLKYAAWERSLIGVLVLQAKMGATSTEVARWIGDGKIPVAKYSKFSRWGKNLQTTLHDPNTLPGIMDQVPNWRSEHREAIAEIRKNAAVKAAKTRAESAEKATERTPQQIAASLTRRLNMLAGAISSEIVFQHDGYAVPITEKIAEIGDVTRLVRPESLNVLARLRSGKDDFPSQKERKAFINGVRDHLDAEIVGLKTQLQLRAEVWSKRVATISSGISGDTRALFEQNALANAQKQTNNLARIRNEVRRPVAILEEFSASLDRSIADAVNEHARKHRAQELKEQAGLNNYANLFPLARSMRRKLTLHLGPTNSGKTHAALERLAAADCGVYLAPLRLMALEGADRLNDRGLMTDMITGEEMIRIEGSRHTSSTIEMADLSRIVDIAVVDEIQLIADQDRGWAWTQAVIGMPAREIIMTGSTDALPFITRIAQMTGDDLEVISFERKTPLKALEKPIPLQETKIGDAIIAFSRAEVLRIRGELGSRGLSVATIYGALGPEVRKSEAQRFRSGEARILVATDAIGMGLNLPIKRVLFSSTTKFDGISTRRLTASEIRQIGGRAGRYGLHESGEVGVLSGVQRGPIAEALRAAPKDPHDDRLLVMPPWHAIAVISKLLMTEDLEKCLRYATEVLLAKDALIRPTVIDDTIKVSQAISASGLSLRDRFSYLGCPIDTRQPGSLGPLTTWARRHSLGERNLTPRCSVKNIPDTDNDLASCESDAKLISAYLWLALRWPAAYPEADRAKVERNRVNALIEGALKRKTLNRSCKECGGRLHQKHRFPICNGCHSQRYRSRNRFDRDFDLYDQEYDDD